MVEPAPYKGQITGQYRRRVQTIALLVQLNRTRGYGP